MSIIKKVYDEMKEFNEIASFLNLNPSYYRLKKLKKNNVNAYEIAKNMIYFYPVNDGMPTCSFEFYKNGELIIDNKNEFSEIANLDNILLQMVRMYDYAIDNKIILDPYFFMLELTDDITKDYCGNAKLVITEKAIRNQKINFGDFDDANKYYINHFLDHFMCWNFGVSINRNEQLKEELEKLNNKVIKRKIRKYAGPGFEVYGELSEEHNGIQHYELPTEKPKVKKK